MQITDQAREELHALVLGTSGPDIPNTQRAVLKRLLQDSDGIRISPIVKASGNAPTLLDHVAREGTRENILGLAENLIHYFDTHPKGKKSTYRLYILHTGTTDTYALDIAVNKPSPFSQRVRRSIQKSIRGRQPDTPFLTSEGDWPTINIKYTDKAASPPAQPKIRIFLCHASEDKRLIRDFHRKLKNEGFEPWLDEVDLIGGQDWDAEIRKKVRESNIVAVFLSPHSTTKTGYVQKEIKIALDVADEKPEGTIYIIPARLEECKLPDRLSSLHCVDLWKPNGFEALVKAIRYTPQD